MNEPGPAADPLARLLELGLCAVVVAAPLPFASVVPTGRLALEIGAVALGLVWVVRGLRRETKTPSVPILVAVVGLLSLAALQAVPLGSPIVGTISPESVRIRDAARSEGDARQAEQELIGADPQLLRSPPTLSVDPVATASALRTGVAMALLLLVGCTVAATRGARSLALALLVSAAFQGLYGLLVLASGYDHIWHLPKTAYLDSATGTFVNRNHFACYMAMGLSCGVALILHRVRQTATGGPGRRGLARWLGGDGSRDLLLGLLLILGLAGLLASLSRTGTALGLLAVLATFVAATRRHPVRVRAAAALIVVAAAAIPLAQLGADRLFERYSRSASDIAASGGRAAVWADTAAMAARYPVAGSGFGTFAAAYPLYRSPEVRLYYAHAHNDLVQLAAESGAIGVLLLGLLLIPLLRVVARTLAGGKGTLAIGFAAALCALLLHGLIDFNFHIPANAATGAALAGVLLGLPWKEPS